MNNNKYSILEEEMPIFSYDGKRGFTSIGYGHTTIYCSLCKTYTNYDFKNIVPRINETKTIDDNKVTITQFDYLCNCCKKTGRYLETCSFCLKLKAVLSIRYSPIEFEMPTYSRYINSIDFK